jgi:hypothetical protein
MVERPDNNVNDEFERMEGDRPFLCKVGVLIRLARIDFKKLIVACLANVKLLFITVLTRDGYQTVS